MSDNIELIVILPNLAAVANVAGTNTGDETAATLEAKLNVSAANVIALSYLSGVNTGDQDVSGFVPNSRTVNGYALVSNVSVSKTDVGLSAVPNIDCSTTANVNDSTNKRYVTDANLVTIGNQSGTNTGDETAGTIESKLSVSATNVTALGNLTGVNSGDETKTTIQNKIMAANTTNSGYLTSADWNTFNAGSSGGVPSSRTVNGHALVANVVVTAYDVGLGAVANANTTSTSAITDSSDKRFVTDAELAVLVNTSGTNTGDQSLSNLVPYIGATGPVTLGANALSSTAAISANTFLGLMGTVSDVSGLVATDATQGSIFRITLTEAVTLSNPTGMVDGQSITYWIAQDGTGGWAVTLDTAFDVPVGATITWSTAPNLLDMLSCRYDSVNSKWHVISFISGYAAT
jgi:hypothetical protein